MTLTELSHRTIRPTRALRLLLNLNGVGNLAGGALLLPMTGVLHAATGLPAGLLTAVGAFYLLYGAAQVFGGTRSRPRAAAIVALLTVNLIWAMDCLLMLGTVHPTTFGSALLTAEAVTVMSLAGLQFAAYHRSYPAGSRQTGLW